MSHVKKSLAVLGRVTACLLTIGVTASVALGQSAEDLSITMGKSLVIDYPVDVTRISTTNPDVVDAVPVSSREIMLHAKAMGVSTVIVWSKEGQRTFYNVTVDQNLEPARRLIRSTFPSEDIQVLGSRDSITLIGRATTKEMSDRAAALAASMAKTVVNNLKIAPAPVEKQVLLRVKFAELDRSKSAQYGVNLFSTGAGNTPALVQTGQFGGQTLDKIRSTIPSGVNGFSSEFNIKDVLNIFAFRPELNLGATIKALQTQGILQILAEPNIVTTMGKEATFLVGGEFPIPVLQGGSGAAAVTIQFREFGIRLNFKPEQTENNTMRMYVKPEVSTIDLANSVSLNGFTIPALATRRMETNVELAEGQSFVIGGLIDERVNESLSKVPGLSSIPVLGALFKSRNETKSKSELFVIVTPEIVDPLNPGELKPELNFPKDWIDPLPARPQPKKQGENITPGSNTLASIPAEQQVIVAKLPAARPQEVPRPVDAGVPAVMALTAPTPAPSPAPIPAIPAADPPPGAAAALIETASPPARTENISPAEGPAEPGALAPAAASAPPASVPVPLAQAVR